MACERVTLPNAFNAIVCGTRRRARCACGRPAPLLCDWLTPTRRGTCSAPICTRCATSPAPDKDLCPDHARAYQEWKARRTARQDSSGDAPECAPLTDIDAPATVIADVSVPEGRSSKPALAAAKPETVTP